MKDPFSPEPTALQIRIAILVVGISTAVFATNFIFDKKMEQAESSISIEVLPVPSDNLQINVPLLIQE